MRGGCFFDNALKAGSSFRHGHAPANGEYRNGLRLAKTAL